MTAYYCWARSGQGRQPCSCRWVLLSSISRHELAVRGMLIHLALQLRDGTCHNGTVTSLTEADERCQLAGEKVAAQCQSAW